MIDAKQVVWVKLEITLFGVMLFIVDTKLSSPNANVITGFGVMLFMVDTKQRFKKTAEELVLE